MGILPLYVLAGFGAGLLIVLFIQNIRLALHLLWLLARVAVLVVVVALAGSLLGAWELPQRAELMSLRIEGIWRPLQNLALEWLEGLFERPPR